MNIVGEAVDKCKTNGSEYSQWRRQSRRSYCTPRYAFDIPSNIQCSELSIAERLLISLTRVQFTHVIVSWVLNSLKTIGITGFSLVNCKMSENREMSGPCINHEGDLPLQSIESVQRSLQIEQYQNCANNDIIKQKKHQKDALHLSEVDMIKSTEPLTFFKKFVMIYRENLWRMTVA